MSFANPAMLFGALAVAVPIIIHLIHRRRAKERPFSAIDFVLRSRKAVQRKFRLRQWILLALRCLLLAAVGVALAKPLAGAIAAASSTVDGPAGVVILVDASMSMQVSIGSRSAFDIATEKARSIVESLSPESETAIILFDDRTQDLTGGLTADRDVLSNSLNKLVVGYRGTDITAALDAAENLLTRSDKDRKIAIVLTDMAGPGWQGTRERTQEDLEPEDRIIWRIVDVTDGTQIDNLAASELSYREEPGSSLAVTLTGVSYAAETKDSVAADLQVDGKELGKGFLTLEPGGKATKRFTISSPSPGVHQAAARLGADALQVDDVRFLVFRGRSRLRVLVVDGDPTTLIREAETFYLERALLPRGGLKGDLAPRIVDSQGLATSDLSKYDVLVLANTSDIPSRTAAKMRSFVENGGGLLISVGDRVNPKQLNGLLNDLMPMRIRGWRTVAPTASATAKGPLHITPFPSEHPILKVFDDDSLNVFEETRFRKVALLEGGSKATTLLKFNDGTPALVEHQVGRGRVILFASTLDRSWNDLPIATVYLALFRRTVRYLGGDLEAGGDSEATVGRVFRIRTGDDHTLVRLVGPTETEIHELVVVDGLAEFTPEQPGFYRVLRGDGTDDPELARRAFAANTDPIEGDLRKVEPATLVAVFGKSLEVAGARTPNGPGAATRPYWGLLLLLGVAALLGEGILTR